MAHTLQEGYLGRLRLRATPTESLSPCRAPPLAIPQVFDDCRQDALTVQTLRLLRHAFDTHGPGLHLLLRPYAVVPTRTGSGRAPGGILEVIPDVRSRDEIGKVRV